MVSLSSLSSFLVWCLWLSLTDAGKNPCHPASHKLTPAYGCTKITLPKGLCGACNVNNITSRGHYVDCTATTTTETPVCRSKFLEYLQMNPCDTARKTAYEQYTNTENITDQQVGRSLIDYYLYSVCEQSCDCLPLQSTRIHKEVEIRRGNCQAHTRYDICKVLPNIRLIRGEGTLDDVIDPGAPRICQKIAQWWNSPDRDNWQNRQDHYVDPQVAYFLHRSIEASEMVTDDTFWHRCFDLETSQERISSNHDHWQVVNTQGIPDGRHEGCFVWHEGLAYLIGGRGRPIVSVYNPRLKRWTNHSDTTSRRDFHHSQCVSLNGKIWFPNPWKGGFPNEINTDFMPVYDPQTQKWDHVSHAALPELRRRGSGASVVYNGKIYTSHGTSGGHATTAIVLALLDVYDPDTKTWTALADAAYPRDHTGGAVVRDVVQGDDLFCVAGGRESVHGWPSSYSRLVLPTECYNFASNTWETKANITTGRAGASYGTTCDQKLMVAGGEVEATEALATVEVFDGETWTTEPSLQQGRHGSGIAFDCSPCGEAHIASGNPTRGGGPDLVTTETFFREGISCERPLASAPTASPRPPDYGTQAPTDIPTMPPTNEPTAMPVPAYELYVNCGQRIKHGDVVDALGRVWVPDEYYIEGRRSRRITYNVTNLDTEGMQSVYQTGRWRDNATFAYVFPFLPQGNYKVSLFFAETWPIVKHPGKRIFNVYAQDSLVLDEYDIVTAAGGFRMGTKEEFVVVVGPEGEIKLSFEEVLFNPMVSGIAIEALFALEPPEPKTGDGRMIKYISCGGDGNVTDGIGREWVPDTDIAIQGPIYYPQFTKSVSGTDAPGMNPIYKSQRTHSTWVPFRLNDLPNGSYRVTLHFMEQKATLSGVGLRQFHVEIQGIRVLTDFDPFATAGDRHVATRQTFETTVVDGQLQIDLRKGAADNPVISAIEVEELSSDGTMAPATVPATSSPTGSPSTLAPTGSPSTLAPTSAPSTLAPTLTPTDDTTTTAAPNGATTEAPSFTATDAPVGAVGETKYISCGGEGNVTDGNGREWIPDTDIVLQGRVYFPKFPKSVSGTDATDMNPIYKSQRIHAEWIPFRVSNLATGSYSVILHFVEQKATLSGVGLRQFHVDIQGVRVLTNFDVFATAGARHAVTRQSFETAVTDGELQIDLRKGAADSPVISAIELVPLSGVETPSSAPTSAPAVARLTGSPTGSPLVIASTEVPTFGPAVSNTENPVVSTTDAPNSPGTSAPTQSPAVPTPSPYHIRMSCGAATTVVTEQGIRWISDKRFVSEGTKTSRSLSTRTIENMPETSSREVMRTIRFSPDSWSITLPKLPPGPVKIRLHFNELWKGASEPGERVFHVELQGVRVLDNFDIVVAAGGFFRTTTQDFDTTVGSNGIIKIDFVKGPIQNPSIAALEVVSNFGTAEVTSPPVTQSPASSTESPVASTEPPYSKSYANLSSAPSEASTDIPTGSPAVTGSPTSMPNGSVGTGSPTAMPNSSAVTGSPTSMPNGSAETDPPVVALEASTETSAPTGGPIATLSPTDGPTTLAVESSAPTVIVETTSAPALVVETSAPNSTAESSSPTSGPVASTSAPAADTLAPNSEAINGDTAGTDPPVVIDTAAS